MAEERTDIRRWEELEQLVGVGDAAAVQRFLKSLPLGETAYTLARMEEGMRTRLLELLPPEDAADLVEALSDAQAADMIEDLSVDRAAAIVDEMASDEQADVLAVLKSQDAEAILARMDPEEADDVRRRSRYAANTAGGLMITEYVAYSDSLKIDDVVRDMRQNASKYSSYDLQNIYVVESKTGKLRGVVRLQELVLSAGGAALTAVSLTETLSVKVGADLDRMEDFFDRNDLYAAPVVDEWDRLVGVVRRAHVQEALAERAGKTILRLYGIVTGEEIRSMKLRSRMARRLAFLIPNIFLNLVSTSVIAIYEPVLAKVSALMIFLPILSDMCGCSGNQAVAVSLRELTLGLVKPSELLQALGKEIRLGLINGLILGTVLGLITWMMRGDTYPYLGLVVGGAMAVNNVVAVCFGGSLPLLLKSVRIDPALAAGPILTTVTDLCAFFFALTFVRIMLYATGMG
jgi:magnesium transporter